MLHSPRGEPLLPIVPSKLLNIFTVAVVWFALARVQDGRDDVEGAIAGGEVEALLIDAGAEDSELEVYDAGDRDSRCALFDVNRERKVLQSGGEWVVEFELDAVHVDFFIVLLIFPGVMDPL